MPSITRNTLFRFSPSPSALAAALLMLIASNLEAEPGSNRTANEAIQLPPIEIQGTRNKVPLKDLPTSVSVISDKELEMRGHFNIEDMIREEVGIDIPQNGGLGTTAVPNIRGLGGANTLVLIDGIQVNSNSQGNFDMSQLLSGSTGQIEIIRGTQSTVWGSDAVGGVINIVSRSGQGLEKPQFFWGVEGGSFATFKTDFSAAGDLDLFDYAVSATVLGSGSISSAEGPAGNPEADSFQNRNVSTRLGWNLPKQARVEFIGHFYFSEAENDADAAMAGGDSQRSSIETNSIYLAAPLTFSPAAWWDVKLNPNAALRDTTINSSFFPNQTVEDTYTIDLQNNFRINDLFSAVLGGEYQKQKGKFPASGFPDESIENGALYFQGVMDYKSLLVLTAGGRHDDNTRFGTADTYKIEAAFNIPQTGTRLHGARATGFRAPTLNQLFISFPPIPPFLGGFFGNTNLRPEKSESWEVGIDQSFWDGNIALSTLYFHTAIRDQISFIFDAGTGNTTALNNQLVISEGFETTLKMTLPWNLWVSMNHTWTDANNRTSMAPILGVADHKFNAQINHTWKNKLNTRIGVTYRGESFSFDQPSPLKVPDFTVVRASLNYQYSDRLTFTMRGENILDEDYQEVANFGTPGAAGYVGFKYYFHK